MMDFLFFTLSLEGDAFTMGAIITNFNNQGAKFHEDVFPHEHYHMYCYDNGQRFGLDPFSEVIDNNQQEFGSTWVGGNGPTISMTHW